MGDGVTLSAFSEAFFLPAFHSERVKTLMKFTYEQLCEFEHLYQAHCRARLGKRYKKEVMEFEFRLSENLMNLKDRLKKGIYKMDPYRPFTIFDPKKRQIYAPSYRDRVVQHCFCDQILVPLLEPRLIYDNAASRKGKGTHFALERTTAFFRRFYQQHGNSRGYILKCDVRKYFDSIDHRILYETLRKTGCLDQKLLWFLRQVLGSYHTEFGKGLPLGNQSSQWFALYYLDRMDRIIKEQLKIQYYSRYMDDCILIHHDRVYLQHCLEVIREHIEKERLLAFNEKTQIMPISQGVDYLGFHFFLTDTGKVIRRLRTKNKQRIRRRLKAYQRAYAKGKLEFSAIRRSLDSYQGHLAHGHTYRLRKNLRNGFVLKRKEKEKDE